MPLAALHIQAQHRHAQASRHSQVPCVARKYTAGIAVFIKRQYTASHFQRNNKSGRLRWVFSKAAARRQFATSAWWPPIKTSGTFHPRKSAGRV
jgi:hypothetical protein